MLRLLLRLYPKRFREALGEQALRMLRSDLDEARAEGGASMWFKRFRLLGDFALQGMLRRVDEGRAAASGLSFGWAQDLRFALRASVRNPAFALVSVFSLAIGIAVNGVMFSVTDTLFLRDIPGVDQPDRILEVGTVQLERPRFGAWSWPDFAAIREQAPLAAVAFHAMEPVSLLEDGGGRQLPAMFTSTGYFETLGVDMVAGRTFSPGEDSNPGEHRVAILSHSFWMERFEGRGDAVGAIIRVNREPYTVIGIAPAAFTGHMFGLYPALWLPISQHPAALADEERFFGSREVSWGNVLGRMGPDTTVDEVNAALGTIFSRLAREHPESNGGRSARAAPAGLAPADARGMMALVFGLISVLTLLVLAATCANVAGMLLARASAREQELAIRVALGSPRHRLVRHLMTEAVLVFAIGGSAGVWLARTVLQLDPNTIVPVALPVELDLAIDWRLGLFGLLLTGMTGVVFGLLPALQVTRRELSTTLRDPAGGAGRRAGRLRRAFVGIQVAIAVLLLGSSGLSLRSVLTWADIEPGFDVEDVYVVSFDFAQEGYDEARGVLLADELVAHLEAQPSITAATIGSDLPLDGLSSSTPVRLDDPGSDRWLQAHFGSIAPGYFDALGIEVLEGRGFRAGDRVDTERVAIVNKSLAREAWPNERAVGRTVLFGLDPESYTVVGVVEDTRADGITDPNTPQIFAALAQRYDPDVHLAIRRAPGVEGFNSVLQREILAVDPSLALSRVRSLEQLSKLMLLPHRIMAATASALGAMALLLSALGLYGVIAFAVTRQTREIGVRIALGAGRATVVRRVVAGGLLLALPGLGSGLLLAIGLGQVMQGILPVSALDPITYLGTVAILLLVVVAACLAPAWRASSIHPVEALRFD